MKIPFTKSAEIGFGVDFSVYILPGAISFSFKSPYGVGLHFGPFFALVVWLSREGIAFRESMEAMFSAANNDPLCYGEHSPCADDPGPGACCHGGGDHGTADKQ